MTTNDLIKELLDREGRIYTEDDNDPPTKYGITIGDWAEYVGHSVTRDDIKALREFEDAYPFYIRRYISKPGFDQIADEWVKIFMIDTAVLQGIKTAIKLLQKIVGTPADGVLGPATLVAIARFDRTLLKKQLITSRMHALIGCALNDPKLPRQYLTSTDLEWLHGWWNRVASFI